MTLSANASFDDQLLAIRDKLKEELGDSKLDAVFNVAGGWQGGNLKSGIFIILKIDDFTKSVAKMFDQSVVSSAVLT